MIPFPDKKYQIIYADPPWDLGRGGNGHYGLKNNQKRTPYNYMDINEIMNLPVKNIADKNCHLYLWVINKYIEYAYGVARSWGFKPSCLVTWCKPKHGIGMGGTFVQTTEHLLFCRRGILKAKKRINTTWHEHKRHAHSVKPKIFRDMAVEISGDLPRIELFARQKTEGWDVWGNEV